MTHLAGDGHSHGTKPTVHLSQSRLTTAVNSFVWIIKQDNTAGYSNARFVPSNTSLLFRNGQIFLL